MNAGYEAKDEAIFFAFVDLKKAYDSVPRDALWLVMRNLGVPEVLIEVILRKDGSRN